MSSARGEGLYLLSALSSSCRTSASARIERALTARWMTITRWLGTICYH